MIQNLEIDGKRPQKVVFDGVELTDLILNNGGTKKVVFSLGALAVKNVDISYIKTLLNQAKITDITYTKD